MLKGGNTSQGKISLTLWGKSQDFTDVKHRSETQRSSTENEIFAALDLNKASISCSLATRTGKHTAFERCSGSRDISCNVACVRL